MDGNPAPSADFIWPHVTASSPTNVPSVQLRSFVYLTTYSLEKIDASYCGRMLHTTIRNQIGKNTKSTRVTVLCKFSIHIHIHSFVYLYTDVFISREIVTKREAGDFPLGPLKID